MHPSDRQKYLEDKDSPMKISFRLLIGRRLGLEKLSCGVPAPEKQHGTALDIENKNSSFPNDHIILPL